TLAKELKIDEHVHFVGFQQNPYQFFHQADVFALTSVTEGFGHVLVEAMATHTPVVSTRCAPGGEEVLQNGRYGKLCEVGNATEVAVQLVDVLQFNEIERTEMIAKGQERASQFSVEHIVKQYEQTFMEILE